MSPVTVNLHSIVSLNVKEILTWNRSHIWSLNDSNGIRTHNLLVRKWTLNHLASLIIALTYTAVYFDSFGIRYITLGVLKKSRINQLLTEYLEYKTMNLLCVDFIASLSGNICLQEKLCKITFYFILSKLL